jgi:AcrR family transcriptional regulator
VTLSAKGTRLNRRGLETRTQLLDAAVACLAEGGPEAVSANQITRRAGVTWGVVQHQFGDVDGLWAAVLDHISADFGAMTPRLTEEHQLGDRVSVIVDRLWRAVDLPGSHAIYNLRLGLPQRLQDLKDNFPRTAESLAAWDEKWTAACERAFADLAVDPVKLAKVIAFLPGAMMGLRNEMHLVTYADLDQARDGLSEAIAAYLAVD